MTPAQIESAAEALYEGALNAEEFAFDGEWVPEEYRAQVWKRAAEKVVSFAEYMGREK
jgi:hypothetical protein